MRFEDFDVLLFPGARDNAAHVPCKEFRVQCAVVRDSRGNFTPLLTGFIPSLAPGSQFQISIHSWTPQRFRFHPEVAPNADSPQQVWHVQLTVDGVIIGIEIFQPDVVWPKVISLANTQVIRGRIQPLRFPQFHEEVMKESSWDALSDLGRIKVEISEGYLRGARGNQSFVKLTTHAIFSFQHAPMDILQGANIAWPNHIMMQNPISRQAMLPPMQQASTFAGRPQKRNMSISSMMSSSPRSSLPMPGPPPPTPNYSQDLLPPRPMFDGGSRSTSAYSNIPASALPLTFHGTGRQSPPYPDITFDPTSRPDHIKVRLPSDQLNRILGAVQANKDIHFGSALGSGSMLPPPLPQHAVAAKVGTNDDEAINHSKGTRRADAESNMTDVSMHANCDEYPACMSHDAEGHVFHQPGAPATVVCGRKEGSAGETSRDLFSHIMDTKSVAQDDPVAAPSSGSSSSKLSSLPSSSPADPGNRKRTRAALKSLGVNDFGSPEKQDKLARPARKVSRRNSDKENADDRQMMVDSA